MSIWDDVYDQYAHGIARDWSDPISADAMNKAWAAWDNAQKEAPIELAKSGWYSPAANIEYNGPTIPREDIDTSVAEGMARQKEEWANKRDDAAADAHHPDEGKIEKDNRSFDQRAADEQMQSAYNNFWTNMNSAAVNNAVNNGLLDRNTVFNQDGSINWGALENTQLSNGSGTLWKDAAGNKKSLHDVYAGNGVDFDTGFKDLTPKQTQDIMNNMPMAKAKNQSASQWFARNLDTNPFTEQDENMYIAGLMGADAVDDKTKALMDKAKRNDDSGMYEGQDILQLMKDYNAADQTVNGGQETAKGFIHNEIINPADLEKIIDQGNGEAYSKYMGGNTEAMNDITHRLVNEADFDIKNPNGERDMGPTSIAKFLANNPSENIPGEIKNDLKEMNELRQARLNSAILAGALANGTSGLEKSKYDKVNEQRLGEINKYLNFDTGNPYHYSYGNFEYAEPNKTDVSNIDYSLASAPYEQAQDIFDPKQKKVTKYTPRPQGWISDENIDKALSNAGVRRYF